MFPRVARSRDGVGGPKPCKAAFRVCVGVRSGPCHWHFDLWRGSKALNAKPNPRILDPLHMERLKEPSWGGSAISKLILVGGFGVAFRGSVFWGLEFRGFRHLGEGFRDLGFHYPKPYTPKPYTLNINLKLDCFMISATRQKGSPRGQLLPCP